MKISRLCSSARFRFLVGCGVTGVVVVVLFYGPYQKKVTAGERKKVLTAISAIDPLELEEMSKSEFVRQDVLVHQLVGEADQAALTKADRQIAGNLKLFFYWVERERQERDEYDSQDAELSKLDENDRFAKVLYEMMSDSRKSRYKAKEQASQERRNLVSSLE